MYQSLLPCFMKKTIKNNTLSVHIGQGRDAQFSFPVASIIPNSAVLLRSIEDGWDMLTNEKVKNIAYQRYTNPTVEILEEKYLEIEGSKYALAVNSGMTACFLVFRALLKKGDHIVTQHSLYHEVTDQLEFDRLGCVTNYTTIRDYSMEEFIKAFAQTQK